MKRWAFLKMLTAMGFTSTGSLPLLHANPSDALGAPLPRRPLGQDGETVALLGFGGY